MAEWEDFGLSNFLSDHPELRLKKLSPEKLVLEGRYGINAQMEGKNLVNETIRLRFEFDQKYPKEIPNVYDVDGLIPESANYHINVGSGTLCLGSTLRVLGVINSAPSLKGFLENCVDPFLYSVFHKLKFGEFPYGELEHFEQGLIQDYEALFGVSGKANVLFLLKALSLRKRLANKLICPCHCGQRLGRCNFRYRLGSWRVMAKRQWYRDHLNDDFTPIPKKKRKKARKNNKKSLVR